MALGERIRAKRLAKHISRNAVANQLGITYSGYKNYENNIRTPSIKMLAQLAELFDVSIDYLVSGKEPPASISLASDCEQNQCRSGRIYPVQIPILCNIIPGVPVMEQPDIDGFAYVPNIYDNCFYIRALEDSMAGDHIRKGDLVLIRPGETPKHSDIILYRYADGPMQLARYWQQEQGVWLLSSNPAFSPVFLSSEQLEHFHMLGTAVQAIISL